MPLVAGMYYSAYGAVGEKSATVVLIHGAGGTHLHWPSEVRRLPGYQVNAVDLPGHGKSEGRGQQSIDAYARYILDWMDAIGLDRAVFVGHSMGGAITLHLAIHHPERVHALGLVGTGGRLRVHPAILENTSNPTTFQNAVDTIIAWAFGPEASPRLVELSAQRMAETRPSVLHGDFSACDAFDEMEQIASITQPALVICGKEDKLTPLRYSHYLADRIEGASLVAIPQAGHMVMLEQPQAVAEALKEFLDALLE